MEKINPEKENFMFEAVKLSEYAVKNNYGGPFGAVIVKNEKIIAQGYNQVIKTNDPTAHAEIIAIREASKNLNTFNLSGCELYASCEPCPMCLAACYWANIDKIYYANTKKDAENIGFKDNLIYKALSDSIMQNNSKLIRIQNIEAKKIFEKWMCKQDKIIY